MPRALRFYFERCRAGVWENALSAAVLDAFVVRPSRNTLDAALAAAVKVWFFAAITPPSSDRPGQPGTWRTGNPGTRS